jgi:hypothetical protein
MNGQETSPNGLIQIAGLTNNFNQAKNVLVISNFRKPLSNAVPLFDALFQLVNESLKFTYGDDRLLVRQNLACSLSKWQLVVGCATRSRFGPS